MLQSINIRDFQSHKDTELEFSPGVNVITGTSDSGKTAILRALQLAINNKPSGDAFISHWADDMRVSLETDEGRVVRKKGGKGNEYKLVTGENSTVFKAFKSDVPQEVSEFLNITPINLQGQLDSPFLLSESPGKVANYFNKIARLDKIDSTRENIEKGIRKIKSDVRYKEGELERYEEKLDTYPNLELLEIDLRKLEKKEEKRNIISNSKKQLEDLIVRIGTVEDVIKKESKILPFEKEVDNLLQKINKKEALEGNVVELTGIYKDIESVNLKTAKLNRKLVLEESITVLIQKITEKRKISQRQQLLYNLKYKVLGVGEKLLKTQKNVEVLKQRFDKEMGDVCVLCGSKLIN